MLDFTKINASFNTLIATVGAADNLMDQLKVLATANAADQVQLDVLSRGLDGMTQSLQAAITRDTPPLPSA